MLIVALMLVLFANHMVSCHPVRVSPLFVSCFTVLMQCLRAALHHWVEDRPDWAHFHGKLCNFHGKLCWDIQLS